MHFLQHLSHEITFSPVSALGLAPKKLSSRHAVKKHYFFGLLTQEMPSETPGERPVSAQ